MSRVMLQKFNIHIVFSRIAERTLEKSLMSFDESETISNFHKTSVYICITYDNPKPWFCRVIEYIKPQTKAETRVDAADVLCAKLIVQVLIRTVIYKRHALSRANSQLTPKSSRISQTSTNRFVESPFNIVFQSDFTYTMNYAQLAMVFTQ